MKRRTKAARNRRQRSGEEAAIRSALGVTKEQYDSMRRKTRRTAADAMRERLNGTQASLYRFGTAATTALGWRLGRMADKAALSEKDRGALELMAMILDEVDAPGALYERLLKRCTEEAMAGDSVRTG